MVTPKEWKSVSKFIISRRFFFTQLVQNETKDKETFPFARSREYIKVLYHYRNISLNAGVVYTKCTQIQKDQRCWVLRKSVFEKGKHFFSSCQVHLSGATPVCHFASIIDTTVLPRACLQMFFKWLQMFEMFNKLIVYWLCWYHFQVLKWLVYDFNLFLELYHSQSPFLR